MAKRNGGDSRGSSEARRRSKQRLLDTYGNGVTVQCAHCPQMLTFATLERDRVIPGGPYAFWNLQPSCRHCNASRSNNPDWISPLKKLALQSA